MERNDNLLPYRGDKLRLARLAKGYSLDGLGKALGVTRQNVHKMEAGQEPTLEQLPQLCELLGVRERYFYAERNNPVVEDQCHFRSLRSRTKTLTSTVMARAELLDALVKELEKYYSLPDFKLPDVSDLNFSNINDIDKAAERVRHYWDLGNGPIEDMTIIVENAGVIVATVDGVNEKVDAFSMSRKRPIIIRNSSKKSPCRYRFDLAHELGHLVMHDGLVTGCKETEKQANFFASAFLMPKTVFHAAVQNFPIVKGTRSLNWLSLYKLKRYFKVSFKALLYRANSLGLISDDQMRSGYIYLNKSGQTKKEELDDELPIERPHLLCDLLSGLPPARWYNVLDNLGFTQVFVKELLPQIRLPVPLTTLV